MCSKQVDYLMLLFFFIERYSFLKPRKQNNQYKRSKDGVNVKNFLENLPTELNVNFFSQLVTYEWL